RPLAANGWPDLDITSSGPSTLSIHALTDDMSDGLLDHQRPYARPASEAAGWAKTPVEVDPSAALRWPQMAALRQARATSGIVTLETVVEQVKPTVLIGTSTSHGAFTQQVVESMS